MLKTAVMTISGLAAAALALGAAPAGAQTKPSQITVLSGSPGGTWYQISAGMAKLMTDKGINTRLEQGGGGANVMNIAAARAEASFGLTMVNYDAVQGTGMFKGKPPVKGVMGLNVLFIQVAHTVVSVESGVTGYDQLKGKRVASQPVSNGSTQIFRDTLAAYGLNGEDDLVIVTRGGPEVGANAVKDRQAVGFILTVAPPAAAVMEVAQSLPIRLLPVTDAAFARLSKMNPSYARAVIPAGAYKGVDKDVPTVGDKTVLMTHQGVSADTAYWIVRTIAEALPEINKIHPAVKDLSLKEMPKVPVLPLHPGAAKYYKEVGAM
ncbi:MAG: TAXI family TRAP transporter solute-binding subunit [Proteobacteria bacterium]|nr:TAXI family TRAP transporter solute-binding subunit [Pseudomonadota bacterium]